MLAERILMGLLLGGIAVGCVLVLYPFFSAILWAGILVFTTWPLFEWLRLRLRVGQPAAAAIMVLLTAVVIVLPLALAAPEQRRATWTTSRSLVAERAAGRPAGSARLARTRSRCSARCSATCGTTGPPTSRRCRGVFRPYFGMLAEGGFSLLLGIANGVVLFLLALFIAFFFYLYGEPIAERLQASCGASPATRPSG